MATKKQVVAGQRRTLKAMKAKLIAMAEAWYDEDEYNVTTLTDAADRLQQVADELLESQEA